MSEWPVSAAEYHADTSSVSHSALEDFRRSVPLYHARYIAGTLPRDEPTPAMKLGTAVHVLALEPEKFESLIAIAPDLDRRSKADKESWAIFEASSAGKTIITLEQFAQARHMAEAIGRNRYAAELIAAPGRNEATFKFLHNDSGLWIKGRFDRLLDCGIILDLKTAADPSPSAFARSAYNFGYHRQDAFYRQVRSAALGIDRDAGEFVFVVVGSTKPHECFVYELDTDAQQLGWSQTTDDLEALADRQLTGNWESTWANQLVRLSLPGFAYREQHA